MKKIFITFFVFLFFTSSSFSQYSTKELFSSKISTLIAQGFKIMHIEVKGDSKFLIFLTNNSSFVVCDYRLGNSLSDCYNQ